MAQPLFYQFLTKIGRTVELLEVKIMLKYGTKSYGPLPFSWAKNIECQRDEKATFDRWTLISKHLPKSPFTVLDIGCSTGFFSFKMAENGADLVLGFDTERGPILVAEKAKHLERIENVAFCIHNLTPQNIGILPSYDVILFMSVFHHLTFFYDFETAKSMLKQLISRTKKVMFFETGQAEQGFGNMALSMPGTGKVNSVDYLHEMLVSCGAKSVVYLGASELKNEKKRHLFAVIPN